MKKLVSILAVAMFAMAASALEDSTPTNAVPWTNSPIVKTTIVNAKYADTVVSLPAPGITDNGSSTNLVVSGFRPTATWRCAPTGTVAVSMSAVAPRGQYMLVNVSTQAVSWASNFALVCDSTLGVTNVYLIQPWTNGTWSAVRCY
jgi:hypothetical protein